jgi:hypothetical protein
MYQISRAIYRELAPYLQDSPHGDAAEVAAGHRQLLQSCEAVVERLARDPYCFADPARTLFWDIRSHFPMSAQERVHSVVYTYMEIARRFVSANPLLGYAELAGEAPPCRATTRKGTSCRRPPLPHNGYCASHQHLAETEDRELMAA